MYCRNCGAQNSDEAVFCKKCGAKLKVSAVSEQKSSNQQMNQMSIDKVTASEISGNQRSYQIPDEYRPIGMWGYFGYMLLFSIPIIGLICELVFAFGGAKNVNVRNFARAQFCMVIVYMILVLFIVVAYLPSLSSLMYYF